MKRLIVILMTLLCTACVERGVRTAMPDYLESTGQPQIRVNINENFKYMGKIDIPNGQIEGLNFGEAYIYVKSDSKRSIQQLIVFSFGKTHPGHYYRGEEYRTLLYGHSYIAQTLFKTRTTEMYTRPDKNVAEYIIQNDYIFPNQLLTKRFKCNPRANYFLNIDYFEPLDKKLGERMFRWKRERHSQQQYAAFGHTPTPSEFPPDEDISKYLKEFQARADFSVDAYDSTSSEW